MWYRNTVAIIFVSPSLFFLCNAQAMQNELYGEAALGYEQHDGFYTKDGESGHQLFLRRLKAGWKIKFSETWSAEAEIKYAYIDEADVEAGDLKLMYSPSKRIRFTLGNIKLPFGLERDTSFRKISTVERSLETDTFTDGRNPGLSARYQNAGWFLEGGAFQTSEESDSLNTFSMRSAYCFLECKHSGVHLGISVQETDWNGQRFQLKQRPELETADTVLRSARFNAEKSNLYGLEMLAFYKNIAMTSEVFSQEVEQTGSVIWNYWGAYGQIAIGLNGEKYRYKSGELKQPKSNSDWGNWEWVARIGQLDIRDHNIGSEDRHWLTGINAYFPHDIRFSINYMYHDASGDINGVSDHGHAVTSRIQIEL